MGLFSTSKPKLSRRDLERAIRDIDMLESSDRKQLMDAFDRYESGGISEREIKRVARRLFKNKKDDISKSEVKATRRRLLKKLR